MTTAAPPGGDPTDARSVATVPGLLAASAERAPDALALLAPGSAPLTYRRLREQVEETARTLAALGLGRGDRVALALPDGPETAVAFLAVASTAAAAPLNPALTAAETGAALASLGAAALIVPAGDESPVRSAAVARDLPVLELWVAGGAAGLFALAGPAARAAFGHIESGPAGVALLLHTSGTTARPKLVPLSHANLIASARHVTRTLNLGPDDRCLNVMPLFHIHGLVAGLLASLVAGAGVVCPPGFRAPAFFPWLFDAACRPTWYTAVPTMHRAILDRASDHAEVIATHSLRLIRSSSAPLPSSTLAELEATFGAPVIEAYGMTEAAHQMASNPLPPRPRKPGSVGLPAGPEVAISDGGNAMLPPGATGEVVVRGPNVFVGYEANPTANAAAFTDAGWFRTGDQGYLDGDGYLFLTGRLKELINRGGEKIAPREVEEALLAHPAVAEAVAFALPDERLGEEVAAAVVARPGWTVDEGELRRSVAARLAPFKVPRRVAFLAELPKGATGKVQRVGLADALGLTVPAERAASGARFIAPRTEAEQLVAGVWAEVLGRERVGVDEDFLNLGGDSILAIHVVARLRQALQLDLTLAAFFEAPTVAAMAQVVEGLLLAELEPESPQAAEPTEV